MKQTIIIVLKFVILCLFLVNTPVANAQVVNEAAGNQTLRLAVMPTVGAFSGYENAHRYIDMSLRQAVHVPLNGVLQRIDYLSPEEISIASDSINYGNIDYADKDAMARFAANANADIVVGVKVDYIYQTIFYTYEDDSYLMSRVGLRLFVYNRKNEQYHVYRGQCSYNNSYSTMSTADALAQGVIDELLKKADLKQYVR